MQQLTYTKLLVQQLSKLSVKTIWDLPSIQNFYKKINEWDTDIEPKEKEYIFEADEIISKNYEKLKDIKSKIEKKYFEKQKEMLNDLNNANKWLPENKKIDPHSIESDFQKIANEFGKVTNLYIYPNTENMNLNIKIKDNDKCNIISWKFKFWTTKTTFNSFWNYRSKIIW